MRRSSRLVCCVGLAVSMFAPAVLAAPPVLDRVPSNAIAVVTTPSFAKLHKNAITFAEAIQAPLPIPDVDQLLFQMGVEDGKGVNAEGSVAMVFLPPPAPPAAPAGDAADDAAAAEDAEEPNPDQMVVLIIPTTGYADFVGNFNITPGGEGAIDTGEINGEPSYFKDLGGGFLAMAPMKETIERADWKPGNAAAHNAALGETGQSLVDASDLSLIVFTQQAKQFMPQLEAALDDKMADNPAGEMIGGVRNSPLGQFITGAMMEDSTAGVTSIRMDAQGLSFDSSLNFKEGSATARKVAELKGSTQQLLSKLPAQPYFLAMAMDLSAPGARKLVDEMLGELGDDAQAGFTGFLANWAKNADGGAMVMGMPPGGLMAGLFTSTISYVKTSNPDAFLENMQQGLKKLNGQSINGLTMETNFAANGGDIEGTKVGTWGIKLAIDENSPDDPGEVAMALPVIFGQSGGPSGYIAPVNGGLLQTFGRNQGLISSALKVNNADQGGFAADKLLAKVAEQLPKNRIAEAFVGIKSLLESALPLAAMANVDIDIEIPPSLPPIGMGLAGGNGGFHVGIYLPAPTVKTIAAVAMQAQAAQMGGDDFENDDRNKNDDDKGAGQPRF